MVTIWTGRVGAGGASAVDTTLKSASTPIGKLLAPTKALVYGHKAWRGDRRFQGTHPSTMRPTGSGIWSGCGFTSASSPSCFASYWNARW
jgi:hypothetical protein